MKHILWSSTVYPENERDKQAGLGDGQVAGESTGRTPGLVRSGAVDASSDADSQEPGATRAADATDGNGDIMTSLP